LFKNFSIIIPIFNEEENIENLIFEIINNITKEEKINFEIIVVNDSSTDKSLEILEEISKKIEIIVVNNDKNVGQSYSILNGVLSSKFDTIVTLDGDGQNDPKDIYKLVKIYSSSKDIKLIGGIRTKRKDNIIKILSSKIANYVRNLILNDDCTDTGCGIKVFDKIFFYPSRILMVFIDFFLLYSNTLVSTQIL